jgi:hypothetical protein
LFHFLLVFMFFNEKSTVILMVFPLKGNVSFFSDCFHGFIFIVFRSLIMICIHVDFCGFIPFGVHSAIGLCLQF